MVVYQGSFNGSNVNSNMNSLISFGRLCGTVSRTAHKAIDMGGYKNLYTCAGCMREYLLDNTQCNSCGHSFCPDCATWWDDEWEYCYSCQEHNKDETKDGKEEEEECETDESVHLN